MTDGLIFGVMFDVVSDHGSMHCFYLLTENAVGSSFLSECWQADYSLNLHAVNNSVLTTVTSKKCSHF